MLSGGLDSATVMMMAREQGLTLLALSFDYGQRHDYELQCARALVAKYGLAEHLVARIETGLFAGSSLTDSRMAIPDQLTPADEIPSTYVPGRNILFLSYAVSFAESRGADEIHIGVNAMDYSGYPDCRPEFVEAFQTMIRLGTKSGSQGAQIRIRAPLIEMTKAQIIAEGQRLGLDYGLTSSCYQPGPTGQACQVCESCRLRQRGFEQAGLIDPRSGESTP